MFLPVAIALLIAIPLYAVLIAGRRMGFNWAVEKSSPGVTAFSWALLTMTTLFIFALKGLMVFGLLFWTYDAENL